MWLFRIKICFKTYKNTLSNNNLCLICFTTQKVQAKFLKIKKTFTPFKVIEKGKYRLFHSLLDTRCLLCLFLDIGYFYIYRIFSNLTTLGITSCDFTKSCS